MTVLPATINFKLYPYATFSETQTLKDSDDELIDLTDYTALMHIRREREDETPLFTLSSADGSIVLGGALGTIQLLIDFDATADVEVDSDGEVWHHDILLRNTGVSPNTVDRYYHGVVIVYPAVTRAAPPATP